MKNQAFLIATHHTSESVFNTYSKISTATTNYGITFLLYHQKDHRIPKDLDKVKTHLFTDSILHELGYIPLTTTLTPGSNHFSLLQFFLQKPNFKYYWYIEDDVKFSGNWEYFFKTFTNIKNDFISTHLKSYDDDPTWNWWKTLGHPEINMPLKQKIRSFNPIYRISNAALALIHKQLLNQWFGHHEVLLPTLLYHNGFELLDLGGVGKFTSPKLKNKFYTPDTFRWRPVFSEIGSKKNKLYHPVKDYI